MHENFHCIAADLRQMSVAFRNENYDVDLGVTDLPITGVTFLKADGRNDLAILKVAISTDLHHQPVDVINTNKLQNVEILLLGYGVSSVTAFDSQVLRKKSMLLSFADSTQNTFQLQQNDGGICFGDSGGPVLYFDQKIKKYFLVGIASGLANATTQTDVCHNASVFTNILFYKNQIQELQ